MMASPDLLALRIAEAEDFLRELHGERYEKVISPFRELVEAEMRRSGIRNPIRAALAVAKNPRAARIPHAPIYLVCASLGIEEAT